MTLFRQFSLAATSAQVKDFRAKTRRWKASLSCSVSAIGQVKTFWTSCELREPCGPLRNRQGWQASRLSAGPPCETTKTGTNSNWLSCIALSLHSERARTFSSAISYTGIQTQGGRLSSSFYLHPAADCRSGLRDHHSFLLIISHSTVETQQIKYLPHFLVLPW